MKIAVAAMGDQVSAHFGHCEYFHLYDVKDGKVVDSEAHPSPPHKPGYLPNYLADLGVKVIISGGMGGGAVDIFNQRDVEVVVGAAGGAREAAEAYLAGELVSTGAVCHSHDHQH